MNLLPLSFPLRPLVLGFVLVMGCSGARGVERATPSSLTAFPSDSSDLAGDWAGEIVLPTAKLGVVLAFQAPETEGGIWRGSMSVPSQGLKDLPFTKVEWRAPTLLAEATLTGAGQTVRFEGRFELARITGTFQQGGTELPLKLWRPDATTEPEPEAARPEGTREVEVKVTSGDVTLVGSLLLPTPSSSGQKPPVAVLVSGSGPQDRNVEVFGMRLFEQLSHALARQGIATLRYDERGVGASTGDFGKATTADFASDVSALVSALAARNDVDTRRIGIIGHSEGGMVAPWVAVSNRTVAFIVLIAGPVQPIVDLLREQNRRVNTLAGRSPEEVEDSLRLLDKVLSRLVAGAALDPLDADFQAACIAPGCSDPVAFSAAQRAWLSGNWFRHFVRQRPLDKLRKVKVPILALNGSLDSQVPSELNLPLLKREMKRVGHREVTVQELEGVNHLMQAAETGSVAEYATLEKTIVPEVPERMARWIAALQPAR